MPITVEDVRLAMNAVADAPPDERRQRLLDLFDAAIALKDRVMEVTCPDGDSLTWTCPRSELSWHCWLVQENDWLTANWVNDPVFLAREVKYIRFVKVYQEACDVIAAALDTVREATDGGAAPRSKQGVWRQLSEPPF